MRFHIFLTDFTVLIHPETANKAEASRNSSKGGSGIGLSIVKKIIEDHKGKIWAESVEGEGTTMHINLLKDMDKRNYICIEDNRKKEKK